MNLKLMKRVFFLSCLMMFAVACSKTAGKTSSTVKIVSGNFAAILSSKANNGLILYGRSTDGKSFSKKIDTDTIDMVFPNGSWNFYAVSWEVGAPTGAMPDFNGKTYCGKTSAVFTGVDASIQIDLTNANCADPVFSGETKLYAGDYQLPKINFITCKDISGIVGQNTTACDQNSGAKFNKGYATSYRFVAYETKNFGDATPPVKIAQSACVRADFSTLTGLTDVNDSSVLANAHIPTNFGSGLPVGIEVFYGEGAPGSKAPCDGSNGVDVVPVVSARSKAIPDTSGTVSIYNFYVQSGEADTCNGLRLSNAKFGGGFGTQGSPYAICTKGQMDLLRTSFSAYKSSSFDLLTDIDYGLSYIAPIGDVLQDAGGGAALAYGGGTPVTFDGHNHKISNFLINCKTPAGTADNNDVGFFRFAQNASFKNLTINNGVMLCGDTATNVGTLIGRLVDSTSTTSLTSIRVHAHGEGFSNVGGVVGNASGNSIAVTNVHAKGSYNGKNHLGGLFGSFSMTASTLISRSSFGGELHSDSNSSTPVASYVGGIAGAMTGGGSPINMNEVVVRSNNIEGSTIIGGFIGESSYVSISDSYVEASIGTNGNTDGTSSWSYLGGVIGKSSNGNLSRVIAANGIKHFNKQAADTTVAGLIGSISGTTCSMSYFSGFSETTGCGTSYQNGSLKTLSTYFGFSIPTYMGLWDASANPSPSYSCSTPDDGKYYEVSTAKLSTAYGDVVPGDILLCHSNSLSVVSVLNKATVLTSAPYLWSMPDDGYDIPRLSFEAGIESSVPYLQRECHGHYTTQTGAGTLTDPKWICTVSQLTQMSADQSSFYALKKNIFFDGTVGTFTPISSGIYRLNGNGYGLYNFSMTIPSVITNGSATNFGIFEKLQLTSEIANLRIEGASIEGNALTTSGLPTVNIGILTGLNVGVVKNIKIFNSKISMNVTAVASDIFNVGGAIGTNSGTFAKSEIDVNTNLRDTQFPAGSVLYAGSVIGVNLNTIDGIRNHGGIEKDFTCNSSAFPFAYSQNENIGAFVGKNTAAGMIKEVDAQGELRGQIMNAGYADCTLSLGQGLVSSFVANNAGTIQDFKSSGSIWSQGATFPPYLFASNSGTVQRGIIEFDSSSVGSYFPQAQTDVNNAWNASTDGSNSNPSIAPQAACTLAEAGNYYVVSVASASTNVGPVAVGDTFMCNGATNVKLAQYAAAVLAPMSEVFYTVRANTYPPLKAGFYYSDKVEYAFGAPGVVINDNTTHSPIINFTDWAVATDFFNPAGNAWQLDSHPGQTVSKELGLVKTSGGLDEIGAPFI